MLKILQNYCFFQFKKIQRNITVYNPFTHDINRIENDQTVTNQPNRSNDQLFVLKTISTIEPTLSKLPLAPLKITDTFSLSSTNKNPFQTKTNLNDTANPCQTLYQPHTAAKRGPYATLPSSSSTFADNTIVFHFIWPTIFQISSKVPLSQ